MADGGNTRKTATNLIWLTFIITLLCAASGAKSTYEKQQSLIKQDNEMAHELFYKLKDCTQKLAEYEQYFWMQTDDYQRHLEKENSLQQLQSLQMELADALELCNEKLVEFQSGFKYEKPQNYDYFGETAEDKQSMKYRVIFIMIVTAVIILCWYCCCCSRNTDKDSMNQRAKLLDRAQVQNLTFTQGLFGAMSAGLFSSSFTWSDFAEVANSSAVHKLF